MKATDPPAEDTSQSPAERVVDAVYEDGVIRLSTPLDLPDGTHLRIALPRIMTAAITLADQPVTPLPATSALERSSPWTRLSGWLAGRSSISLARFNLLLFSAGMLVYILTRFWEIARFPIYFFCDEAMQVVLAEDLLEH